MLPIPAFFYIRLNLIYFIFRKFWDPLIAKDIQYLGRGQHITKEQVKYYHALPLLRDAFRARIITFLITFFVKNSDLAFKNGDKRVTLTGEAV